MLESILNVLIGILIVGFGITILIFVHELGHFITAKLAKVKVEAFSLGFGPKVVGIKYKETEYKICAIPLGGYVKMAGENIASDEHTGSPDEFLSKPPLTRIPIFIAGAAMNLIFALPVCILVYLLGVNFTAPVIGSVKPDSSEWNSSLQPGDEILTVDNKPMATLEEYTRLMVRLPKGTTVTVKVKRGDKEIITPVVALGSKGLGLLPLPNIIKTVTSGTPADKGGLKANDEIIEVDGMPIYTAGQIENLIQQKNGSAVNLKIKRSIPLSENAVTSSVISRSITPTQISTYDINTDGLYPVEVKSIRKGTPAESAGLMEGDKIIAVNGADIPSFKKYSEITKASAGKPLVLKILRGGQEKEVNLTPNANPDGTGWSGIVLSSSNILGEIPKDSPLEKAGLWPGDRIIKVNDKEVKSLAELDALVIASEGKPIKVQVQRGKETIETQIVPRAKPQWMLGIELKPKAVHQQYGFLPAIAAGTTEFFDLFSLTFQLIGKLVTGEESPKGLAGPVGIFRVSYIIQKEEGLSKFLWLLALFSLNLAILNLLPIPILDGGGVVFTLIEKIKGSPVSMKTQVIAQYVGLFLLLSLVFFATYNDIRNL